MLVIVSYVCMSPFKKLISCAPLYWNRQYRWFEIALDANVKGLRYELKLKWDKIHNKEWRGASDQLEVRNLNSESERVFLASEGRDSSSRS